MLLLDELLVKSLPFWHSCASWNDQWAGKDGSDKRWGGEQCVLGIASDERKMAMVSIAEIGANRFGIGLELVAEREQRFCVWFALELCEFLELEAGIALIDTSRHHCLDNHQAVSIGDANDQLSKL
jgi:hypothetical protein